MSNQLGGRREVLTTPAVELFKYIDLTHEKEKLEAESERTKSWIHYLSNVYAQPTYGKPSEDYKRGKSLFEEMIMPKQAQKPAKVYEWDFEKEKRLNAERR